MTDLFLNILVIHLFFSFVCMGVLPGCMCVHAEDKKTSDPLDLELQMVVSCHVDARTQILVL